MKLIGFSLDQFLAPELILPLMDKGDLKSYLAKETNTVSYKDAIKEWMKFSEKCLMKIIVEKNSPFSLGNCCDNLKRGLKLFAKFNQSRIKLNWYKAYNLFDVSKK